MMSDPYQARHHYQQGYGSGVRRYSNSSSSSTRTPPTFTLPFAEQHPPREYPPLTQEYYSSTTGMPNLGQGPLLSRGALQISTLTQDMNNGESTEETAHPSRPQSLLPLVDKSSSRAASLDLAAQPTASTSTVETSNSLSRPLTAGEAERLKTLDKLKFFLTTAPAKWDNEADDFGVGMGSVSPDGITYSYDNRPPYLARSHQMGHHPESVNHPQLNRFLLPSQEYVSCVLWAGLYHITGTDIVRALVFRFEAFGRPVKNMKKFEEGVFSDLRNLKPGTDASLEEPKSPFLDLLFKYQCIRTQKKQKVFYWFSVPHDRLFLDALERDLKREKQGQDATTVITGEPAQSFVYDPKKSLYEQFSKLAGSLAGEGELETAVRRANELAESYVTPQHMSTSPDGDMNMSYSGDANHSYARGNSMDGYISDTNERVAGPDKTKIFSMFSLPEGAEKDYKLRSGRRKGSSRKSSIDDSAVPAAGHRSRSNSAANDYASVPDATPSLTAADAFTSQATAQDISSWHTGDSTPQRSGSLGRPISRPTSGLNVARRLAASPYPSRSNTYPSNESHGPLDRSRSRARSFAQDTGGGTMLAYQCPLLTCQRLFKHVEHLQSHHRAHTMQRPYQCQYCKKGFSRSDSLSQHTRVHIDGIHAGAEEEFPEFILDDEACHPDACRVEVDVLVPSDEEGVEISDLNIIRRSSRLPDSYQSAPTSADITMDALTWSPSQMEGPQPTATLPNRLHRHSFTTPSHSDYQVMHDGSPEPGFASMSAPPHKEAFDHSLSVSSIPFGSSNSNGSSARRHRSMTPSIYARPDAVGNGSGQDYNQSPSTRGYHPYATSASGYTRHMSVQSSPGLYSSSLDYVGNSQPMMNSLSRPASAHSLHRSSPHQVDVQDQIHEMLNIDQDSMAMYGDTLASGGVPGFQPATFSRGSSSHYSPDPADLSTSYDDQHMITREGNVYYAEEQQHPGTFTPTSHMGDISSHYYTGDINQ